MFEEILQNVKEKSPLIHCITNYITTNDCANVVLACGASPTMAEELEEMADIVSLAGALVINIGNLSKQTVLSMLAAGKKANALKIPVILDPVGAGASRYRTEVVSKLLKEIRFSVIRGNISEMKTVYNGSGTTRGVDACAADAVTEENLEEATLFAKRFSAKTGAVCAITGAIDIVSSDKKTFVIRNGNAMMSRVTGTGCMLTALTGAYCGANHGNSLVAAAAAVCVMGLSGELALDKTVTLDGGTGTFRVQLIDFISKMTPEILNGGAKIEMR